MNLIYKYIERHSGLTEGNYIYLVKFFPWKKVRRITCEQKRQYDLCPESIGMADTAPIRGPGRQYTELKLLFNAMDLDDDEIEALRCPYYKTLQCQLEHDINIELEDVTVSIINGYEFGYSAIIVELQAERFYYRI